MRNWSQALVTAVLVLGAIAAWLSGPGKWDDAAQPVAAALLGAGLAQFANWYAAIRKDASDQATAKDRAIAETLADLDETRRLIVMLRHELLQEHPGPPSSELSASVWNALVHHSDVVTSDEAQSFIFGCLREYLGRRSELVKQADEFISRITAREHSIRHSNTLKR